MIDLEPAGSQLVTVTSGIGDDQLADPTPCTEYSVADLLLHVDETARGFATAAGADAAEEPLALTDPAWRETLAARIQLMCSAWADPAVWEKSYDFGGLDLPNEMWGRIGLTELIVHGWDLAHATGQQVELPDETLRPCLEHLAVQAEAPLVPELWASPVPVPDDAPLLDRVIGLSGRRP